MFTTMLRIALFNHTVFFKSGIQCQAWSETITTPEQLENMLFPRILALAERSWSVPDWYNVTDEEERQDLMYQDWVGFANALGYR